MTVENETTPIKEAARLTQLLDAAYGADRFDNTQIDLANLALEYSRQINPLEPIEKVSSLSMNGCDGALYPSETEPRTWGIVYNNRLSGGRKNFTIAHELGHYLVHRHKSPNNGFECTEANIDQGIGLNFEKEADTFAAYLLMPFNDFRNHIPAKEYVTFEKIIRASERYGASITATILRWLEYTEVRAIMIVSNEGFINWAKSSKSAYKSRIYYKTVNNMNVLPTQSLAVSGDFTQNNILMQDQPRDIWFNQPCLETSFRDNIYDREITILQFDEARYQEFENDDDFD